MVHVDERKSCMQDNKLLKILVNSKYSMIYERLCNLTQSIESFAFRSYCDLNTGFTKMWKIDDTNLKFNFLTTTFGPSTLDAAYVNLQEEHSVIYERLCNLTQCN